MLVQTWKRGFVSLFRHTNLLGSLIVASQFLKTRTVLVIFSDMRDTHGINPNTRGAVPVERSLKRAEMDHLVADLRDAAVYVLGVDGTEKEVGYWHTLRDLWVQYFKKCGAELRAYSMLWDTPDLAREGEQ